MAFVRWVAGLGFTFAAILFAVANVGGVDVVWSPFHKTFNVPLSVLCLLFFSAGFLLGSFSVWIHGLSGRLKSMKRQKEINKLQKELVIAKQEAVSDSDDNSNVPRIKALIS